MTLMQKLFSFEGRLRRRDYWLLGLAMGVVEYILMKILVLAGLGGHADIITSSDPTVRAAAAMSALGPMMRVYGIIWILFIWPGLAIAVKRCHDRDKSGWWLLIGLIPLIGGIWLLIDIGFLDGTPGANKFGPSPKGIGGTDPAAVFS